MYICNLTVRPHWATFWQHVAWNLLPSLSIMFLGHHEKQWRQQVACYIPTFFRGSQRFAKVIGSSQQFSKRAKGARSFPGMLNASQNLRKVLVTSQKFSNLCFFEVVKKYLFTKFPSYRRSPKVKWTSQSWPKLLKSFWNPSISFWYSSSRSRFRSFPAVFGTSQDILEVSGNYRNLPRALRAFHPSNILCFVTLEDRWDLPWVLGTTHRFPMLCRNFRKVTAVLRDYQECWELPRSAQNFTELIGNLPEVLKPCQLFLEFSRSVRAISKTLEYPQFSELPKSDIAGILEISNSSS